MSQGEAAHQPASRPLEIAAGVYCVEVGKGMMRSNVYFVRSSPGWILIDTGSTGCDGVIERTAASLFGAGTPPEAILLTHDHPDHAGSALSLTRRWACPVYVHPDELALATMVPATYLATVKQYANPLDRWVILPIVRLLPERRREAMLAESSFRDSVVPLDLDSTVPHLPGWTCIPTPGHTPGHVSFFCPAGRILITGDAVLTVQLGSLWRFLLSAFGRDTRGVSGPPRLTTWDWRAAQKSVSALAALEPLILASGHGVPMCGSGVPAVLHSFADRVQ